MRTKKKRKKKKGKRERERRKRDGSTGGLNFGGGGTIDTLIFRGCAGDCHPGEEVSTVCMLARCQVVRLVMLRDVPGWRRLVLLVLLVLLHPAPVCVSGLLFLVYFFYWKRRLSKA